MTITKLDLKSLCYLAIVLAAALLVFTGLLYYLLRAPETEVLEEIEELEKEKSIEELLRELTPSEPEPLTEEERREQEELLERLTPVRPKPMTEQEKKEMEELLEQLTP